MMHGLYWYQVFTRAGHVGVPIMVASLAAFAVVQFIWGIQLRTDSGSGSVPWAEGVVRQGYGIKAFVAGALLVFGYNVFWPSDRIIGRWTHVAMKAVRFEGVNKDSGPYSYIEFLPMEQP